VTRSRMARALALRNAAVSVLRRKGTRADRKGLARLELNTQCWDDEEPPLAMSYRTSLESRWLLPHGLSVWASLRGKRCKVLNIEWSDSGTTELISFRRGGWEDELLAMALPTPYLRLVKN
jgi:hypothetical protein